MESERAAVRSVLANGARLAYREAGEPGGPVVVLLHGSTSNAATWDRFAAELTAAGCRSIAVDLRGHGLSERTPDYALADVRDDVVGLLEALDLHDVTLVGHSVGGYAALGAALRAPGRIARLVLEDLAAPPERSTRLGPSDLRKLISSGSGMLTLRRDYDLRAVARIVSQLSRPDPAWWAGLAEVRQPVLVLSGGPRSCIAPERLAAVAAALPDGRMTTIPVGHRVHSLAPETFAAAVMAFLTEPAAAFPTYAGETEAARRAG